MHTHSWKSVHTGDDAKPADSLDTADNNYIDTSQRRQNAEPIGIKLQTTTTKKNRN